MQLCSIQIPNNWRDWLDWCSELLIDQKQLDAFDSENRVFYYFIVVMVLRFDSIELSYQIDQSEPDEWWPGLTCFSPVCSPLPFESWTWPAPSGETKVLRSVSLFCTMCKFGIYMTTFTFSRCLALGTFLRSHSSSRLATWWLVTRIESQVSPCSFSTESQLANTFLRIDLAKVYSGVLWSENCTLWAFGDECTLLLVLVRMYIQVHRSIIDHVR